MKVPRKTRKPLHHHLHDYFLPHERNGYRPRFFGATSIATVAALVLVLELVALLEVTLIPAEHAIIVVPIDAMALILVLLFALTAALMAAAFVRFYRMPHRHVFIGGAVLLLLAFGLILANRFIAGPLAQGESAAQHGPPAYLNR